MNRLERDALEFSRHLKSGGWRLGLLVARNVVATRGRPKKGAAAPNHGKVTATEFARAGNTTQQRVMRHLKAWEDAAKDGHVPPASELGVNSEPDLNVEKLPPWTNYYSTESARPSDKWRSPAGRQQAVSQLSPQERVDLVSHAVKADPTVLSRAAKASPSVARAVQGQVAGMGGSGQPLGRPIQTVRLQLVRKVNEYIDGLRFMADEFGELTEEQCRQLLDAHGALETRVKANIIRLRQRLGLEAEDVIESTASAAERPVLEWNGDA